MDDVTLGITAAVVGALALAPLAMLAVFRLRGTTPRRRAELWNRYRTWLALAPLMVGLVLLGRWPMIAGVTVLSLLCYREFARATGVFRERLISGVVVIGILALLFAAADHWYGFFVALVPIGASVIAAAAVLADRPEGYIQRVALGTWGFMLFGVCLGHLALMANDAHDARPLILTVVLCVEMNDIFAYLAGRSFGRRRLAPVTSPNKTVGGAVGAVILTTTLYALVGSMLFRGTALAHPVHLVAVGVLISIAGQLGDLMLSSIKRDLGLKDLGATLPGHGGLLDRFDSLILAAPAVFHYVNYFGGLDVTRPVRLLTGAGG